MWVFLKLTLILLVFLGINIKCFFNWQKINIWQDFSVSRYKNRNKLEKSLKVQWNSFWQIRVNFGIDMVSLNHVREQESFKKVKTLHDWKFSLFKNHLNLKISHPTLNNNSILLIWMKFSLKNFKGNSLLSQFYVPKITFHLNQKIST